MTRIASHRAAGVVCLLAAKNTPWQNVNNVNGNGVEQEKKCHIEAFLLLFYSAFLPFGLLPFSLPPCTPRSPLPTLVFLIRLLSSWCLLSKAVGGDVCQSNQMLNLREYCLYAVLPVGKRKARKDRKVAGSRENATPKTGSTRKLKLVANFSTKNTSNWGKQCETNDFIRYLRFSQGLECELDLIWLTWTDILKPFLQNLFIKLIEGLGWEIGPKLVGKCPPKVIAKMSVTLMTL